MSNLQKISSTSLLEIADPVFEEAGVRLLIKRDDLIHPQVSGNKWRKLKYNIAEAHNQGKTMLLTFGGAFSNHIYSTAAAGNIWGFKTIGVIRGEETVPLNPTLRFARECGMEIHYMNREKYRNKNSPEVMKELKDKFGDFYFVPEGGSNSLAVKGVRELVAEIHEPFDYICSGVGTGGTLAGLAAGVSSNQTALGFAALKGKGYLEGEVETLLTASGINCTGVWQINHDFSFGGYAKVNKDLALFIKNFEEKHIIPLDPVYTAKMLFGLFNLIRKGFFERGKTIIAVHTGGLQGRAGMQEKLNQLLM